VTLKATWIDVPFALRHCAKTAMAVDKKARKKERKNEAQGTQYSSG
jgi:hypothetical protein